MAALTLTTEAYRDKVSGGWLGKSAGITLGSATRGQKTPGRINYYSPVPGQPAPSIAIDFPLVWLSALAQAGPDVTAEDLAVAWLEHLDYSQDEYGYAALNIRRGLPPPCSGSFSNWFRHSSGGAMRADLWGLLAPGAPQVAAAYAYRDAQLDHSEEGLWAAMLIAAVTSAAFFLSDPIVLLTIGLAMVPRTCRVARAIKTVLAAAQRKASWLEARESVQHEVGHPNFSDAPQNLGFLTIGLMYGGGDFGRTLCAGVNCGYDSEMVGGALGAVMGVKLGAAALPQEWVRPIGDLVIPGIGLKDFDTPPALSDVIEHTVEVGRRLVTARCPDMQIADQADLRAPAPAELASAPVSAPAPPIAEPSDAPADGPPAPIADASPTDSTVSATSWIAELGQNAELPTPVAPAPAPQSSTESVPVLAAMAPEPSVSPVADAGANPAPAAVQSIIRPQPVSEAPAPIEPAPSAPAAPMAVAAPVAPDVTSAIAWADNSLVKPLLVTPPTALAGRAGPFQVVMDTGDSPTIGYGQVRTLSFAIANLGDSPFTGRISLLVPGGWQVGVPPGIGQRQYIAAHTGTFRVDFTLNVNEGQGRIDLANTVTLRLAAEGAGPSADVEFLLLGSSCWWTTGPFANFDGEGFDRSYTPEDRPGLTESYVNRMLQSVRWERKTFPDCVLDLDALFKGGSGVVYGQTILRSPTAREARIAANTNSGVKVWFNGALVLRRHSRETFRPTLGDGPWASDVSLRAGDNPVMVKWVRGIEPYQFSLTVSDRSGRGLAEVGNTTW